jgi:hypothetical protein
MQPLYERQGIEIERPDMVELRLSLGGLDRLHDGLHRDAFPYIFVTRRALFSRRSTRQY